MEGSIGGPRGHKKCGSDLLAGVGLCSWCFAALLARLRTGTGSTTTTVGKSQVRDKQPEPPVIFMLILLAKLSAGTMIESFLAPPPFSSWSTFFSRSFGSQMETRTCDLIVIWKYLALRFVIIISYIILYCTNITCFKFALLSNFLSQLMLTWHV